ncbi:MAG: hypothetical protein II170_08105 [Bacteroidaceae bacterium]|nr:hypothetical protein [Bacteroidaceae bacterium]MBQ2519245.1 hypothetical protein [Bacteroidaceae bacterium]
MPHESSEAPEITILPPSGQICFDIRIILPKKVSIFSLPIYCSQGINVVSLSPENKNSMEKLSNETSAGEIQKATSGITLPAKVAFSFVRKASDRQYF